MVNKQLSPSEKIKVESRGLRGTLKESLHDEHTAAVREDDQFVIKFHGMYQQDDRDARERRAKKKLDRLYSFMIRLRLPGGVLTAQQWLATHDIANGHSTGTIKITTRQTVQLHGVVKSHIKPTLQAFNLAKLDSIATCGDVNRNVVCNANPATSGLHAQVHAYADKISELLKPKTRAYYEIWLDDEKIADKVEEDPLYEDRYLPRKFKIAIAIPPNNDADVFANDIGLIAIVENQQLKGFNISVGGGLATTHGNPNTYPRRGTIIGFCDTEEKTLKTVYEILTVQRDFGNREDRKLSRLKYTVDKMGVDAFKKELEKRIGFSLAAAKSYTFTERGDQYGWIQNQAGLWHYTVFVESGLVRDIEQVALKTALYEIAKTDKVTFRFTCNQNVILSDIESKDKPLVEKLLAQYGLDKHTDNQYLIRLNSVACVALNTCPLALAEGQRYLPTLISKIEPLLEKYNLLGENISIRMTGCPNGCARPYLAEIGLIGTAYGKYNLHIAGDNLGERLNTKYKENLDEVAILKELDQMFNAFSKDRKPKEPLGDYLLRTWIKN